MPRTVDPVVAAMAALFALLWAALAIRPLHRADWALENVLTVAFVAVLWLARHRLVLSRASWAAIFLFLSLHAVGAHYTYSEVPYDAWSRALTGHALGDLLGFRRNHFDRLVHFAYGFLLVHPIRQVLVRVASLRGLLAFYLPVAVTSSTSADYELLEWGAALVFGGDLGAAYLGTQGDVWDAQKDMALAVLGAVLGTAGHVALVAGRRRGGRAGGG